MLRALVRFPPLRRVASYFHGHLSRERVQRVDGLPRGLAFETLDAVSREHGKGALQRCTYVHLSGWKASGTYRLELVTEASASWRLIFKDECYQPESIPALQELPVSPGPPEAVVYRTGTCALAPFLPRLFYFQEVEPRRHFRYLLEDLAGTHVRLRPETRDHIKAVRGLLQMHTALNETFADGYPSGLIRYDRRYSEQLLEYAASNITDYAARTADGVAADLLARWGELVSVHQRDEFHDEGLRAPIHGDFNRSNVHVRGDRLKVVDWEWAGIGLPHADLAALVKSVRPEDHPVLLQEFIQGDRRLDAEQHRRLFHWSRVERRLLDAAFLAKQHLASERRVPWLQAEITRSAREVLTAVAQLAR